MRNQRGRKRNCGLRRLSFERLFPALRIVAMSPARVCLAVLIGLSLLAAASVESARAHVDRPDSPPNPQWSVSWSPDGQRLASGGFDGLIRLWDEEGTAKEILTGHH